MSSHKKMDEGIFDLSLRHSLKNWVMRSQPPVDGKSRLLKAAMQTSRRSSNHKISKISGLISMTLNESFNEIYLDIYKMPQRYSLQPGTLGICCMIGSLAK
jgi:hypothetical protein